ncbi:MAG TPA: DMT family transporter [Vicinamibacterales bacterium]|jgi:drug/metabolite transporter (DMT)-like permease
MIRGEWLSAVFGVASALSWGAGDFCGGLAAKRAPLLPVVIGSQTCGLLALALAGVIFKDPLPAASSLLWCGLAGLSGALGLLALYKALAIGRMGLAAPVSGVLSAAIPVIAGGAVEGTPGWLRLAGFLLALGGVWLVARADDAGEFRPRDLGLSLLAGAGFGCFIVIISWTSGNSVFWSLVVARFASLSTMVLVAALGKQAQAVSRQHLPLLVAAGLTDACGNAFLVLAAHAGRLDVAAVLSSLYPASTVLLAWLVLHERVTRWQFVGLLAVLSAIVMITAR